MDRPSNPTVPPIRVEKYVSEAPHVLLLGAGAARAAFSGGDRFGRQLPLMNELARVIELEDLLEGAELEEAAANFEGFFDTLCRQPSRDLIRREIEQRVAAYFSAMRLPEHVTLYDQLLLSLRAKDIVATFNWEPLLGQALRRNQVVGELPRLLFLHGNVDMGACNEHRIKGFRGQSCDGCGKLLDPTPLLYPVGEKDYAKDSFIANEWQELETALGQASIFTVFGYSAPVTDAAAISLLEAGLAKNTTRGFGIVEVIDIKEEEEVRRSWGRFGVEGRVGISSDPYLTWMFRHARRSCEALGWAMLQQDPWHERPLPTNMGLQALQDWVRPLVEEEVSYRDTEAPFRPCRA